MLTDQTPPSRRRSALEILLLIAAAATFAAAAADAAKAAETPTATVEREVIPGADRMTSAEREAYRRRIESAATPEEKARIRAEYAAAAKAVPAPALVGDAARGAVLHRACFSCHGIERYTSPVTHAMASFLDSVLRASGLSDMPPSEPTRFKGKVRSIAQLRDFVTRRNDYLNPKMTAQEVEDVVAYLNQTYYKFPAEQPADVSAKR